MWVTAQAAGRTPAWILTGVSLIPLLLVRSFERYDRDQQRLTNAAASPAPVLSPRAARLRRARSEGHAILGRLVGFTVAAVLFERLSGIHPPQPALLAIVGVLLSARGGTIGRVRWAILIAGFATGWIATAVAQSTCTPAIAGEWGDLAVVAVVCPLGLAWRLYDARARRAPAQ